MIEDARVLREAFVPREVEHREGEVTHLSGVLEPVTRGEAADTAILTGPSGAGKTCIARYTVQQLREQHLDVEAQYVNCWQNYSRFRALYRVLEGLGRTVDIHRRSTPHDELLERLADYDGPPCVVVSSPTARRRCSPASTTGWRVACRAANASPSTAIASTS
jgi:Cdc6-like AAA superfamily ATPase